ncbi:MAG: hypothetical protein ABJN65_01175 [Parasphingorhabdus sp.]
MSYRIERHWIILGVAAVFMIGVPWLLLSREPEAPPEKQPLIVSKVQSQEIVSADISLQKPIFNAERKPFTDTMARAENLEDVEEALPQQAPAPTLVGVVSKRRGKAVAIVKGQDGTAQTLSPGQNIDGWRLVSVGKSGARFASSSGPVDVNLDFANKAIGGPVALSQTEPDPVENPIE